MIKYLPPNDEQYSDWLYKLYPDKIKSVYDIKNITFQVTEDCCLRCTYCYQTSKTKNKMSFDLAKKFIDKLLNDEIEYINKSNTVGLTIEFIGGEPFLEVELIQNICDYLFNQMIEMNHPWLLFTRISICTNGILYFNDKVQEFINKYSGLLSLSISIDGNKELHDACRVDVNGNGSYDKAISAVHDYYNKYNNMPGIKMTLSPFNIQYTYDAIINLINEGYTIIHLNCIFEPGWDYSFAIILYNQFIKIADYLIDNDLYNQINLSLLNEDSYCPLSEDDNDNWCGGANSENIAINYKGDYYTCIRYMENSLNGSQEPLNIGNIETGIGNTEKEKEHISMMSNITRRSQSTDECFYCPIADGCAWCSAYNYQETGSVNKRVTHICPMHKATSLVNVYYWNKLYKKLKINKSFHRYLSEEESLKIINIQQLNILNQLEIE